MELYIQKMFRKKMESNNSEDDHSYDYNIEDSEGNSLSGKSLVEDLNESIEEEKIKEEDLSVKAAVLNQEVERLKCLVTNNSLMANENEERRIKTHQEV